MDEEFFMEILKPLYTPPFSNPGIDKMARWNNMSRRTFTRTFKRNTGMSITEYLTRAKLIHANYLLENSSMSIKEVASECGYSNSQNLRRALKKFASEEL
jgi:transcriptional regulator GlxA family with amidase domain